MHSRVLALPVAAALSLAAPAAADAPAQRLAAALRIPTISHQDAAEVDRGAFLALHALLARSFPRVQATLRHETVNDLSLLYVWPGSDPTLAPMLLTSHLDVVPVQEDSVAAWQQPPFAGVIADGYVWGRGALDDKAAALATLEAVEGLIADGFAPRRTLYVAFGHDEEVGGDAGAESLTRRMEALGGPLWFSLDEGMAIGIGLFPGLDMPVGMIGIAEKGYMTLRLTSHAPGGHSSMPTRESAIGELARAVERLEASPLPAHVEGVAAETLEAAAPHMAAPLRWVLGSPRLFAPLLAWQLGKRPSSNAMIRTTTAVTMFDAGVKENVLPRSASAIVNFRILPGDTVDGTVAAVRRIVDDPGIDVDLVRGDEPSAVADVDSDSYALLARTIRAVEPEAVVIPALTVGGTDSTHYGRLARNAYRFAPLRLDEGDAERIHGVNERISVENYAEMIRFYTELLRGANESEPAAQ